MQEKTAEPPEAGKNTVPQTEAHGEPLESPEAPGSRLEQLMAAVTELLVWLQGHEPWPDGVVQADDEARRPDLYTLLEGLTVLRQEVSLQGRSFHSLEQALGKALEDQQDNKSIQEKILSLGEGIAALQTMVESFSSRSLTEVRNAGREEGEQQAFASLIDPVLDTHDQLRRWVGQNRMRLEKQRGWRMWFSNRDLLKESLEIATLCEKRLSQRLDSLGIAQIARIDAEFDPKTMKAVEMVESPERETSAVLEVHRQGYATEDRVLRFAEVKVACPKKEVGRTDTVVSDP